MNYLKVIFHLQLLLILCLSTNAQKIEVKGTVLVFDSIPVVKANVLVLSSKTNVKTNHLGFFQCESALKDKLIITAEGFDKHIIRVKKNKKSDLIANLKLANIPKAKDIAIDKGHILMIDQFKQLAEKKSGAKDYSKYTTVMDIIRNEFPSLQIKNGEIIIRGYSSLFSSSAAQIEIDGIMTGYSSLYSLSPSNIASINVIEGSDAAIYGIRGGNGVISIKTKK